MRRSCIILRCSLGLERGSLAHSFVKFIASQNSGLDAHLDKVKCQRFRSQDGGSAIAGRGQAPGAAAAPSLPAE